MSEGIKSLAEAFAAADAEVGAAPPTDVPEEMPPAGADVEEVVEQAEADEVDQPEVAETQPDDEVDNELQSLIDEMGDGEPEGEADEDTSEADPVGEFLASDDFWQTEVEVDFGDGPEPVTVEALSEAAMRQADYTRKTQALAAERKGFENAVEFHKAFQENPAEFARVLAIKAGFLDEGAQPVGKVDGLDIPSEEEIEQRINDEVERRFSEDPRYIDAQTASARAEVNAVFDEIEAERGIKLSDVVRQHIIDQAVRSNTSDLEMVLDAELYKRAQQKDRAAEKRRGAPSRPTATSGGQPRVDQPPVVESVGDAFERALAELA